MTLCHILISQLERGLRIPSLMSTFLVCCLDKLIPLFLYPKFQDHDKTNIFFLFYLQAVVVGYEPSKSNHSLTGALWVKMACGKQFKVGSG